MRHVENVEKAEDERQSETEQRIERAVDEADRKVAEDEVYHAGITAQDVRGAEP